MFERASAGVPRSLGAAGRKWARRAGWTAFLLMFGLFSIRGCSDYFRAPESSARAGVGQASRVADPGPFAALFATTLLSFSPARVDEQRAALAQMVSGDVTTDDLLSVVGDREQSVVSAWPEHPRVVRSHATVKVTVRCQVHGRTRTMYLAVPVVQDKRGVQTVDDYPALVAASTPVAPRVGTVVPLDTDAEAISGLLTRTFKPYVAGDELIPELLVPGTVIRSPVGQRLTLDHVGEPAQVGRGTATSKRIAVTIAARDRSQALLTFGYRVGVKFRGGRWLVSSLNG